MHTCFSYKSFDDIGGKVGDKMLKHFKSEKRLSMAFFQVNPVELIYRETFEGENFR